MKISFSTFLGFCFATMLTWAQQEVAFQDSASNDILNTSSKFKSEFFDALSNKSISSYGKAIQNLENCLSEKDDMPVLYYELAQNQIALKQYEQAALSLQKADELMPKQELILKSLAQVYTYQQNFEERIVLLKQLVNQNKKYGFDLAQAYFFDKQYASSLKALDNYHSKYSYDYRIPKLRMQLFTAPANMKDLVESLQKQLLWNAQNENAYWQLYHLYIQDGDEENASKIASQFKENIPSAPALIYVDFHQSLADNNGDITAELFQKVIKNPNIPRYLKTQARMEFKVQNTASPSINPKNVAVSSAANNTISTKNSNPKFETVLNLNAKNIPKNASLNLLSSYEANLATEANDYGLIKDTILLQLYFSKLDAAEKLTATTMEKYPTQPFLYLVQGSLLANKKNHKSAIANFQEGLDYLVENPELERALYQKIANSYQQMGNASKAKQFSTKATQINVPVE